MDVSNKIADVLEVDEGKFKANLTKGINLNPVGLENILNRLDVIITGSGGGVPQNVCPACR